MGTQEVKLERAGEKSRSTTAIVPSQCEQYNLSLNLARFSRPSQVRRRGPRPWLRAQGPPFGATSAPRWCVRSAGGECPHRQGVARPIQLGGAVAPGAEGEFAHAPAADQCTASLERARPAAPRAPARRTRLQYFVPSVSLLVSVTVFQLNVFW